jgi:hypothetical protein
MVNRLRKIAGASVFLANLLIFAGQFTCALLASSNLLFSQYLEVKKLQSVALIACIPMKLLFPLTPPF